MVPIEIDEADIGPSNTQLASISELAARFAEQQQEIKDLEEKLKAKKVAFSILSENDIPAAMDSVGLAEFKLSDGVKVKIEPFVRGSLPSEDLVRRQEALDWIEENGHGGLIKDEITLTFGKGQEDFAQAILKILNVCCEILKTRDQLGVVDDILDYLMVYSDDDNHELPIFRPQRQPNIHHSTLQAWAREVLKKIEAGEIPQGSVPFKTLGIEHGRKAKVEFPKADPASAGSGSGLRRNTSTSQEEKW